MIGSPSTIQELSAVLERLRAEETALRAEYDGRLATLAAKISAVQTTLQLLDDDTVDSPAYDAIDSPADRLYPLVNSRHVLITGTPQVGKSRAIGEWAKMLQGVKQLDALRYIAQENGGIIHAAEAKRIFLATGLAKGAARNVASHIHHLLADNPDFEKTAPGTFQLVVVDEFSQSSPKLLQGDGDMAKDD